MTTAKNVINKIFSYAGAMCLLVMLGSLVSTGVFGALNGSAFLITLTVMLLFCATVGTARLYTKSGIVRGDGKVENYIFPVTLCVVLGVIIRGAVFILIDVPILNLGAGMAYLFSAINLVLLFLLVTKLWGPKCGTLIAVLYSLWGSFEILTLYYCESLGINLLCFYCAQAAALLSFLLLIHSVSTESHNGAIVLCLFSGIIGGIAAGMEITFCVLLIPALTYYLMSKTRMRHKKIWKNKPFEIKKLVFLVLFTAGVAFSFVVMFFILKLMNVDATMVTIKEFSLISGESLSGFFASADKSLERIVSSVPYPRNYFCNYLHLCVFTVLLLLSVIGSFAAGKKRDTKAMLLSLLIFVTFVYGVISGGNGIFSLLMMPWMLILSVYGMNSAAEFLVMYEWVYKAGVRNPAFTEQFFSCKAVSENEASKGSDDEELSQIIDDEASDNENASNEDSGAEKTNEKDSRGSVAVGDEQDRLLNSLKDAITK